MISHGPSNFTTQQLLDTVALKICLKEYDDALTLIDQCDNLDDIDFNWTALDGPGKGQTLLYLIVSLAISSNSSHVVSSVFNKLKTKPLDFNKPSEKEICKGYTPLLLACLAASMGYAGGLEAILTLPPEVISTLDFNIPAQNVRHKGKTPLWLVCLAASNGHPEGLKVILEALRSELISNLDFNKPVQVEGYKGITPLWLVCLAASNGYPEGLKVILEALRSELISTLDFNIPAQDKSHKGVTPLLVACLAASKGNPEVLEVILTLPSAHFRTLDFNRPAENEKFKGITPLLAACSAALIGLHKGFEAILKALPSELIGTLDFNKPAESEHGNGKTPLWFACLAASKGRPEALKAIVALPTEVISTLNFNKPAENEKDKGITPLWLACYAASEGRPEALKAIVALPTEVISNLDFNKPAENERYKGKTPLWFACLAAAEGHPEGLKAILAALPLAQRSQLNFNLENEQNKQKTPFWQVCKAATIGRPEALMVVIQNIPYKSLDFDSIFNLSNSESLRFFFSNVKELSQAMALLNEGDLHDGITILEQLSKIEIEDKPYMKWVVEKASTEVTFALLNRDISKTGESLLDPSMFMFDILRTQAIEHALTYACALSDELLKAHCVRKLLNISPISSDQKDILDWVCKYKNAQDIIQATRLYKDKQRDLELLDIKSKLEETKSELEASDATIQEMQTQLDDLTKQFQLSSGYVSTQNELITPQFQGKLCKNRSNTSIDNHDTNQALEPKKRKPKN